jgi:negative regulator of flagellin synthesis FlgM
MKIERGPQSTVVPLESTLLKKKSAASAKGAQTAGKPNEAFSVQLSTAVDKATSNLDNDEVRRDKVEAIRKQLASGTYNISGKDVADKILNVLKG